MSIDNAIARALSEYKDDPSIYTITNLFYEDGADDAAQKIYDATKALLKNEDPGLLIDATHFFAKNGVNIDLEKEVRRILEAVRSDTTSLCSLARVVSPSGYPDDARCKPDLPELRDEIIAAAVDAVAGVYDAKQLVELMAGKYQGLHLNNVEWAENFIENCKANFSPNDIKKLKKTLNDVS